MSSKSGKTNSSTKYFEVSTKLITHYSIIQRPPLKSDEIKKIQDSIKKQQYFK